MLNGDGGDDGDMIMTQHIGGSDIVIFSSHDLIMFNAFLVLHFGIARIGRVYCASQSALAYIISIPSLQNNQYQHFPSSYDIRAKVTESEQSSR